MSHAGRPFEEYVAARWADLVRTARLLGAPEPLAVEMATETLARLARRWSRLDDGGDPDAEALELLVAAWDEQRRTPWWRRHPAEPTPAGLGSLDALPHRERSGAVRQGLDRSEPPTDADWTAARALPVAAPPPDPVRRRDARRRRRGRVVRRVAPVVVALVLLGTAVVTGSLAGGRGSRSQEVPRALAPVAVEAGPDAWMAWYAEGRLHLGNDALAIPGLRAVVPVADGSAVYVARTGAVVRVGLDGARLLLGHTDDATSLVVGADGERVGWIESGPGESNDLVVADPGAGTLLGRRTLATAGARPVGLRSDRMYVVDGARAFAWRWGDPSGRGGTVERLDVPGLQQVVGQLAVVAPEGSGTGRVTFLDPRDRTPPERTWLDAPPGRVGVAADGSLLLTRTRVGAVSLTSLSTRQRLPTGLAPDEVALAATVGPDSQVAYVVARAADRPRAGEFVRSSFAGPLAVRTCTVSLTLGATDCTKVAELSSTGEQAVLQD